MSDEIVTVRRQWNDWRKAKALLSNVENLRLSYLSGGIQALAPRPFIHGYVWCNQFLEGEVAHTCMHGEGPHRIKVCIVKKDNAKELIRKIHEMIESK